ncbi:MAG: hypothetical protein EZS28_015516, partial [Streblomastix strix]
RSKIDQFRARPTGQRLWAEQATAYEELLVGMKAEKVPPSVWHLMTSLSEFFKWPTPQTSRGSGGNGPSGNVSQQKRKNEAPNGDIHTLSPQGGDDQMNNIIIVDCNRSIKAKQLYINLNMSSATVRINNIPKNVLEYQLKNLAKKFGTIKTFTYQQGTNKYNGTTFIEYEKTSEAESAVKSPMEQRKLDGVELKIQFSSNQEKEQSQSARISVKTPSPPYQQIKQNKSQSPANSGFKSASPAWLHIDCTSVHISGIPAECEKEDVQKFALQFGIISRFYYKDDSSQPFSYAIIEYTTHEAADAAIHSSANKRYLHGTVIQVKWQNKDYQARKSQSPSSLYPKHQSIPPEPNCTFVHFSGIPIECIQQDVEQFVRQFGQTNSIDYRFFSDGHQGYANVIYQTHDSAQAAVNSSTFKRVFHGQPVNIHWGINLLLCQIIQQEKQIRDISPSAEPIQLNNLAHFAGIPIESSENEFREFVHKFGLFKTFQYFSFDDGRNGYANVEYSTHEQTLAAIQSPDNQRLLHDVLVRVQAGKKNFFPEPNGWLYD